jgi:hypothetical protein
VLWVVAAAYLRVAWSFYHLDTFFSSLHAAHLCSCYLPLQEIHSLRASNIAFQGTSQDEGFWGCHTYCVTTNKHGFTGNDCKSSCEAATPEQRGKIFGCEMEVPSKPWDECYCRETGNCMHTGPGMQISATPTTLNTRPPVPSLTSPPSISNVPSPTLPLSDYENVE